MDIVKDPVEGLEVSSKCKGTHITSNTHITHKREQTTALQLENESLSSDHRGFRSITPNLIHTEGFQ